MNHHLDPIEARLAKLIDECTQGGLYLSRKDIELHTTPQQLRHINSWRKQRMTGEFHDLLMSYLAHNSARQFTDSALGRIERARAFRRIANELTIFPQVAKLARFIALLLFSEANHDFHTLKAAGHKPDPSPPKRRTISRAEAEKHLESIARDADAYELHLSRMERRAQKLKDWSVFHLLTKHQKTMNAIEDCEMLERITGRSARLT